LTPEVPVDTTEFRTTDKDATGIEQLKPVFSRPVPPVTRNVTALEVLDTNPINNVLVVVFAKHVIEAVPVVDVRNCPPEMLTTTVSFGA